MLTSDFDYDLPQELIAQTPASIRDECRMLVLNRQTGKLEDRIFKDIVEYLNTGDLLVANETRVMPARLIGKKRNTGGICEIFLLRPIIEEVVNNACANWEVLVRPGRRLKPGNGAIIDFCNENGDAILSAEIVDWAKNPDGAQKGERIAKLTTTLPSLDEALHSIGKTPLPPYIHDYTGDEEMYQTVYSKHEASAAAPTAGLHFSPELIEKCKNKGVGWQTVDLEVGLDTFRIVEEDDPTKHAMHTETFSVPQNTVDAILATKQAGGRVVAVGTTTVRSLESLWKLTDGHLHELSRAKTDLYLMPGSEFHIVDAMITNFHVPKSTLMMLVSAFASRDQIMQAYNHAINEKYRMLSFGDAMCII